jgi:hypothetical protein
LENVMLLNTLKVLKRLYGHFVCVCVCFRSIYAEGTDFVRIQDIIRSYYMVRGQWVLYFLRKEAKT